MSSAPPILPGSNDLEKLHALCQLTYQQQAVWFLNSFWEEQESAAEQLWGYVNKCNELDLEKHEEGCGLDEMKAHVFLEKFGETLTVRELRAKLRSTGAIGEKERPKLVPLTHYILFKYNVDWHVLVNAAQGDNRKQIEEAQEKLNAVSAAFEESNARAKEAQAALLEAVEQERQAKSREEEAKASAAEAAKQEAEAKASAAEAATKEEQAKVSAAESKVKEDEAAVAQSELEAALAEVQKQEDAYNSKTEELKRKSEEGGVVSRNKAKNELAQHLGEDPLPLRRAKITAEAAVKRAEKTRNAATTAREKSEADAVQASNARAQADKEEQEASAARVEADNDAAQAEQARQRAESARQAADSAKAAADAAVDEARAKVAEAEAFLEEVKSNPGSAQGAIWWMEREIHEKKKYLPESKGGIRK